MSGKLEFSFNASKIADFPLDKEVTSIGRKADNDVRIENMAVSGHHARTPTIFEDSFLEDLNRTNGTYVNGKPISKHPLKHGNVITIGKHELRYLNDHKQYSDDGDKTILIRHKPESPKPATASHEIDYKPISPMQKSLESAKLQILNCKSAGKELPLTKASVKLGKSGSEVVQINKRPDGHFIVSLLSDNDPNNPRINGELIGARSIKLQSHDVIEINRLKIEYLLSGNST